MPNTAVGTWDISQILNVYIVNSCSVFETEKGNGGLKKPSRLRCCVSGTVVAAAFSGSSEQRLL